MKKSKLTVNLKTTTWGRDSHGLFDYESKNITRLAHTTNTAGKLYRVDENV